MGYLDEIITAATTARKGFKKANKYMSDAEGYVGSIQHKSIARGALDGTMQFPCLISDSIPIDMASTLARTLERVYASFVQTYLSTNNIMDISMDSTPNMFMKQFHRNIKLESTAVDIYNEYCVEDDDEYNAMMEKVYDGSSKAYTSSSGNDMIVFNFSDKANRAVYESNKELLEEALSYIDFKPFPNIGNSPFYEAIVNDGIDTFITTKGIDRRFDIAKSDYNNKLTRSNEMLKMQNNGINVPTLLKDNDVKKANDLQPYTMQVRLMAVNDKKEFVQFLDFVVGVKVVLHNIKSEEMIVNIQNTLQNNGVLFNFIRWTSGEKSLIKDLLLNINDVKLDIANQSKGASKWWNALKRLKESSRAQSAFMSRTKFVPQSTLVISSFEADSIEKSFGYNLRSPLFAIKLMKNLFLMNFVIVDEGTRTIDVLYDGETTFQTYALETLEREVSMNSNKLGKELTRMISR